MKTKKKMQGAIQVVFIKEFAGHSVGNVIATDMGTANFLIKKGVCEGYAEKAKPEIQKQPIIEPKEVVVVEKPKGRPKGKVVKKKIIKK